MHILAPTSSPTPRSCTTTCSRTARVALVSAARTPPSNRSPRSTSLLTTATTGGQISTTTPPPSSNTPGPAHQPTNLSCVPKPGRTSHFPLLTAASLPHCLQPLRDPPISSSLSVCHACSTSPGHWCTERVGTVGGDGAVGMGAELGSRVKWSNELTDQNERGQPFLNGMCREWSGFIVFYPLFSVLCNIGLFYKGIFFSFLKFFFFFNCWGVRERGMCWHLLFLFAPLSLSLSLSFSPSISLSTPLPVLWGGGLERSPHFPMKAENGSSFCSVLFLIFFSLHYVTKFIFKEKILKSAMQFL
ncbi:hypothetical protein ANANG_G00181380 [Anguilla anguilla]|uniref:Uncharacterized protein n=1 Tax=Anguilla anguilla TaxID=7936 RepID=A0A9D3M6K9_ANGAN|nr:hypothetical protein ANANG_G00181380 [Anguilla anguilla]